MAGPFKPVCSSDMFRPFELIGSFVSVGSINVLGPFQPVGSFDMFVSFDLVLVFDIIG